MNRRTWIVMGVVAIAVVVAAVGGLLAIMLLGAFIGLVALGDGITGHGTSLRRQEVLRRHLGPQRPPESLTAEPYDDQAWARQWVRARDKE